MKGKDEASAAVRSLLLEDEERRRVFVSLWLLFTKSYGLIP